MSFIYFWLGWVFAAAFRLSLAGAGGGHCLAVVHRLIAGAASLVEEHVDSRVHMGFSSCDPWT